MPMPTIVKENTEEYAIVKTAGVSGISFSVSNHLQYKARQYSDRKGYYVKYTSKPRQFSYGKPQKLYAVAPVSVVAGTLFVIFKWRHTFGWEMDRDLYMNDKEVFK